MSTATAIAECRTDVGGDSSLRNKLANALSALIHADTSLETAAAVVVELVGPKRTRLLHKGISEEKRVFMEELVQRYVKESLPIPMLIPAGLKLPPFKVDTAELNALLVLQDLQKRVRRVYQPGLRIVMRLEDLTLCEVTPDGYAQTPHFEECARHFRQLATFLDLDFLTIKQESELMLREEFHEKVAKISEVFYEYISNAIPYDSQSPLGTDSADRAARAMDQLQSFGWKGSLLPETCEFFRRCYEKRYKHSLSVAEREMLFARYLSCTIARRQLRGIGDAGERDFRFGRMELSFTSPIPGSEAFERTRVWYRSQLDSDSRTPFWKTVAVTRGDHDPTISIVDIDSDSQLSKVASMRIPLSQEVSVAVLLLPSTE